MQHYIGKTFDEACEQICIDCLCGNDLCSPLERSCRFQGDMEELKKYCDEADVCKDTLLHCSQDDHCCFENPYEDLPLDRDYKFADL